MDRFRLWMREYRVSFNKAYLNINLMSHVWLHIMCVCEYEREMILFWCVYLDNGRGSFAQILGSKLVLFGCKETIAPLKKIELAVLQPYHSTSCCSWAAQGWRHATRQAIHLLASSFCLTTSPVNCPVGSLRTFPKHFFGPSLKRNRSKRRGVGGPDLYGPSSRK